MHWAEAVQMWARMDGCDSPTASKSSIQKQCQRAAAQLLQQQWERYDRLAGAYVLVTAAAAAAAAAAVLTSASNASSCSNTSAAVLQAAAVATMHHARMSCATTEVNVVQLCCIMRTCMFLFASIAPFECKKTSATTWTSCNSTSSRQHKWE
eukprot:16137-Heterococcus_DN1.PRE.2